MCFCGRDGYVGLALELKLAGGRVSAEQQRWLDRLAAHGWMTNVAYGLKTRNESLRSIYLAKWVAGRDSVHYIRAFKMGVVVSDHL